MARKSTTILTAAATGSGSSETVVAGATVRMPLGSSGGPVGGGGIITADVYVAPGTTTSACVLKIRKGHTTSGAVVGHSDTASGTASNATPGRMFTSGVDAAAVPGQEYCLTITQTGGAAAGAVTGTLSAEL